MSTIKQGVEQGNRVKDSKGKGHNGAYYWLVIKITMPFDHGIIQGVRSKDKVNYIPWDLNKKCF